MDDRRAPPRAGRAGLGGARPAYGFVLLALRHGSLTPTELAGMLEVTKQAASKLADAMVAAGLVATRPHEHDGRQRQLTLTSTGHELLRDVEQIYVRLEQRWSDALGVDTIEPLQQQLTEALRTLHGGVLPALRPTQ